VEADEDLTGARSRSLIQPRLQLLHLRFVLGPISVPRRRRAIVAGPQEDEASAAEIELIDEPLVGNPELLQVRKSLQQALHIGIVPHFVIAHSGESTLEGVVLGLLALMIGFSFAIALSRFEARRDAVLNEANAIGTTARRARLLPAPYDSEALKSLRQYVTQAHSHAAHGCLSRGIRHPWSQARKKQSFFRALSWMPGIAEIWHPWRHPWSCLERARAPLSAGRR
jgi:hypothetical protein